MLLVSFFAISVLLTKSTTAEVVGVWLFDEGNGKIVKDASGKGHDGEIVGEVAWTEGKFGTGLEFDSGYVIVPHEDIMNLRQWTITAWIKVPAIVDPYQKIISKQNWPNRNYAMWIRPGMMTFGFKLPNDGEDFQVGSKHVTDDKWHFVAGVYDEEHLTPYVDGDQFNARAAAGKPAITDAPLLIGAEAPDGKNGRLKGALDEVAIYNTALNSSELTEIMAGLTSQFQATVEATGKLTITWGHLKTVLD